MGLGRKNWSMNKRFVFSLLISVALVQADTLVLRNGSRVDGNFVGGDTRSVRFAVGSQVNTYSLNDVTSITFTSSQTSSNYSQSQSYPPPNGNSTPQSRPPDSYAAPASAPQANGPAGIQVPSGTQVVVRLIDAVNSDQDRLGQTYRASIDQPVIVNGQTVIPRGADAIATLIDAQKSGRIQGRTVLTLDLKKVTVNDRTYDIVTTGVPQASGSRGERSAKVIGGTAALGAIIGAIAGGGKGAAIGAGSGAAVGTATEVMTSGQKVKIPSETRLTFTLQNALDL
jgi:hypothetical protein